MGMKIGEVFDMKGRPILAGDLVKTFHFRQRLRRKLNYLYHVATEKEGYLHLVPAHYADPNYKREGGAWYPNEEFLLDAEIIDGYGGGRNVYDERPRRHVPALRAESDQC